jgi:uncharacterized protein with ParB-like and HNH nuclease domain
MDLKIVHISDLSGINFNIPLYQRGYRWETKQIEELLDDLLEFKLTKNQPNGQFYCLQPLVVVDKGVKNEKSDIYDVIDGQQRLTTLFLIMHYLGLDTFGLRYERACDKGKNATDYKNGIITYEMLKNLKEEQTAQNPDFFYLRHAIQDINRWFNLHKQKYPKIKRLIEDVIIDENYIAPNKPIEDLEKDENAELHDVRFIWYNASNIQGERTNSIEIFKRLNYGKTPLTSSELIKALLLQCDIYTINKPEMKQVAFRMSTEWDYMEKALQNKFMWSMLSPCLEDNVSHIDLILSMVARDLLSKYHLTVKTSNLSKDNDYQVFNTYLQTAKELPEYKGKTYDVIVKDLWTKIQDTFAIFRAWYADRTLYHLIGLYLTLLKPKRENLFNILAELLSLFQQKDKNAFIRILKKEKIGPIIDLKKLFPPKNGEKQIEFKDLYYDDNKNSSIVNILLVYNVTLCMKEEQDRRYFPFYFYHNTTPSLEHIHPQHLRNEEIPFDTLREWYTDKIPDIKELKVSGMISDDKKKKLSEATDQLNKILYINPEDTPDKKILKIKENQFEKSKNFYTKYMDAIDKQFDELADIDELQLHHISNLALVEKSTNTSLSNRLMLYKRSKLIEISDKFNKTDGQEGACIFPGTWKVFNKEFKDLVGLNGSMKDSNLMFWTKTDRKLYFRDLETIYKEYAE